MNPIVESGVHDEALRLRAAAAFFAAAERSGRWPSRRCLAATPAALLRRGVGFRATAAGTDLLAAAAFLVDCCPGSALGFFLGHAT